MCNCVSLFYINMQNIRFYVKHLQSSFRFILWTSVLSNNVLLLLVFISISINVSIVIKYFRTDDRVKHMKVYEKHMEGVPHYYLSESRFFKSIMELITCYEHASLSENFVGYVTVYNTIAFHIELASCLTAHCMNVS
jgi:hypothetical protein